MRRPRRDNFDDLPILAELRGVLEHRFAGTSEARRDVHTVPGSWGKTVRQVPVIVATVVAIAVVVLALTVGRHGHPSAAANPGGPGPSASQELAYIHAAGRQAREIPACRRSRRTRAIPAVRQGAPSESLLSTLSVLRRPGAPADRLPGYMRGNAPRGMYVSYIRRARVKDGFSYYVVPVDPIRQGPDLALSAGCYAAIRAVLQAELQHAPVRVRRPTEVRLGQLVARQRRRAAEVGGEGVCLLFTGPTRGQPSGGTCGASAGAIEQSGLVSAYGWVSGVVPDGVATVTVSYPAGGKHGSRSVTSNVVGNVFAVAVKPSQLATFAGTPETVWRSADGTIVKKLAASRVGAGGGAYCSSQKRSGCL